MSVLAIPPQRGPSGYVSAPPAPDEADLGDIGRVLSTAGRAVAAAAAIAPASVASPDLAEGISAAARLAAQVAALRLALTAEADRRQVAQESGSTGTDAWTAKLTATTPRAAAAGVRLARLLQECHPGVREAFAAGAINQDQTRVIVEAAAQLPGDGSPEERARAEAGLLAKAVGGMDARRLRNAGRRMLEVVSKARADEDEANRLGREERRAEDETWMTLGDNGDGTWSGRFSVPALHGEMLRAALERLTAPRRLSRNGRGDLVEDPTLPTDGPTLPWANGWATACAS